MREIFTYGSVGGAPGNRCFYPDRAKKIRDLGIGINPMKLVIVTQWVPLEGCGEIPPD